MSDHHSLRVPILRRGRNRRPGNHGNREASQADPAMNLNETKAEPLKQLNPEAEEFVFQPSQPTPLYPTYPVYPSYQTVQYFYPVVFVPVPLPQESSVEWTIQQDVQQTFTTPKTPPLEPIREEGEEESLRDSTSWQPSLEESNEEKSEERDADSGKLLSDTRCVYQLDELLAFRTQSLCQSPPSEFNFTDLLGDRMVIDQTIQAMDDEIEIVIEERRVVGNVSRFGVPFKRAPQYQRPKPRPTLSKGRPRVLIPTLEKDKLMKKTRGILNKIAPDKFELLARRLTELLDERVSCFEHLEIVLDAILGVGVDQPGFAEQYVRLLKYLSRHMEEIVSKWDWVDDLGFDPHSIVKDIVRKLCKDKHSLYWYETTPWHKEFLHEVSCDAGTEMPLDICDTICQFANDCSMMERTKNKFIGVEKIVGELCKQKLVSKRVLCLDIINPLLRLRNTNESPVEEESWRGPVTAVELEAVCKLLSVCGQLLDGKGREWLDEYFRILDEETNGLNKRMQFMVLDLSDLRKAKWDNPNRAVFVPAPTQHQRSPTRMGQAYGHGSRSRGRGFSRMRAPHTRYQTMRR